jgi:hypothetical protein
MKFSFGPVPLEYITFWRRLSGQFEFFWRWRQRRQREEPMRQRFFR